MDKDYSVVREIVIDNFSEYIQTSSKVMPKPYIKGKINIPLKYQTEDYGFKKTLIRGKEVEVLIRKSDGLVLTSNTKTVNKPRIKKVNGQEVYNQAAMTFGRSKIVNILHDYFNKYLKDIEPITDNYYPLSIHMEFNIHDMGKNNVDNDNKWIWRKCLQDSMVDNKVIPDDNIKIINSNTEVTNLIPEEETQSLIIRVYGKNSGS